MKMTGYVIARQSPRGYFVDFAGDQANGYVMDKSYENALKRLRGAALTEPHTDFFLLKIVAKATSPVDVVVNEYT